MMLGGPRQRSHWREPARAERERIGEAWQNVKAVVDRPNHDVPERRFNDQVRRPKRLDPGDDRPGF